MHNTYHFLKHLSRELGESLQGMILTECFSQQKDELILIFEEQSRQFIIQANLSSDFTALTFPEEFHKAKRNFMNLFPEIVGKRVQAVRQIKNDRAFLLEFDDNLSLLFKLHGSRSNLVLFSGKKAARLLKPKLRNDHNLNPDSLDREADHSFEKFKTEGLKKTFFTLGKESEKILQAKGFNGLDPEKQYHLVREFIEETEEGKFFISKFEERVILSLIRAGEIIDTHTSAIKAANAYFQAHYRYNFIHDLKEDIFRTMDKIKKRSEEYVRKCEIRLEEIASAEAPEKVADIIMANLHAIPAGTEKIKLYNFYREEEQEIKLKKNMSPQKFAELLYKKGKKRPLEIQKLLDLMEEKNSRIAALELDRQYALQSETHKELHTLLKKYNQAKEEEKQEEERFKKFEFMTWQIYVGKNAGNNDELTMKFAHKDDLWLHARDVSGSHVVVKHKPGKNFPKPVIEKAASVAAFYSQRKNDSLCPVIYTPKKFVRKLKGAPKGAVRVDKESVVMVTPGEI